MAILNYLPTFKVVEINRSTGLVAGHVLSQFVLDPLSSLIKTVNEGEDNEMEFVENGFIIGLNDDLTVDAYDATTHGQPFLLFTEELNRLFPGHKWFATEADADGDIYPRGIGLYVGDVFTTNNFTGELPESAPSAGDEATVTLATANYAAVVEGVLVLQATKDQNGYDSLFAVEESSLPTGDEAARFVYLG